MPTTYSEAPPSPLAVQTTQPAMRDSTTSSAPDQQPATSRTEKLAPVNENCSPVSSEPEKEPDLETGHRRSISSSKRAVTTEYPAPNTNIVDWAGPDDPQNPMNWPVRLKWGNIAVISSITFLT